ncbi:MAG: hypothetical protein J6S45_04600, partial [Firmicutes bacterium]|nr:hypothetical protein [Bacillota bacterium]
MNNRDHWSPEELAMQDAVDRIREEHPDFWKDLSDLSDLSDLPPDLPENEPFFEEVPREEIAKPDLEKTRRKKTRRRIIAACFVSVLVLSTALAIFINSDAAYAMKFAIEKKYYQAKGWLQATDP